MITLAIVNDWIVSSIVTIDEDQYAHYANSCQVAIDITSTVPQPTTGWTFDGANLNAPAGYVPVMQITRLAFRQRFTIPELVGILGAASGTTTQALTLQVMLQNQSLATFIDLNRSDTIAGVQFLVSLGLITQARATQILTTTPSSIEIYRG